MSTTTNLKPKCWRYRLTEIGGAQEMFSEARSDKQGGGAWARFIHGQEAAVLEARLAKEVRELPKLQAGTQLPIIIPELLALIL